MNESITIITLPLIVGLLLFFLPEKYRTIKGIAALIMSIITLWLTIVIYRSEPRIFVPDSNSPFSGILSLLQDFMGSERNYFVFNFDNLSCLIILFISLFAFLILIYSNLSVMFPPQSNSHFLILLHSE